MSTRTKAIIVTVVAALASFALTPVLWPRVEGAGPTPELMPFFIVLGIIESIAFGIGVAFLLFGWSSVKRAARDTKSVAWALYIGIAWYLISWWPHDNMHAVNAHDDWAGLLRIEYMFHFTLVLAALALAWAFMRIAKRLA